jgi:3-oxoacyl-[acyl-carrier-protein] synthase-1
VPADLRRPGTVVSGRPAAHASTLAVTGLGLVCSVGHDVATACAAIRAGICRPRPVGIAGMDDSGPEPLPIVGHPVHPLTDGFQFVGRWLRLAELSLRDLGSDPGVLEADPAFWARTLLMLVVPEADDRVYTEEPIDDAFLLRRYAQPLLRRLRIPAAPGAIQILRGDRCGALVAAEKALGGDSAGARDKSALRVLVVAVDSWVEEGSLRWLATRHRLKDPDHPAGLMPGEAAACFLLETEAAAQARGRKPLATLVSARSAVDPELDESGRSNGRALAGLLRRATEDLATGKPYRGTVITDLNGEDLAAHDYGAAWALLGDVWSPEVALSAPAASIGDTGAASAAVAICIAVRSLVRDYARGPATLVASRSDRGRVAVATLSRSEA